MEANSPDVDFRYRIFNADGGEVEQCGNGARCFVHFVRAQGLTTKRAIRVETLGGVIEPTLEADGQVTVDMGAPRFAPAELPFDSASNAVVQPLDVGGRTVMMFPWVIRTRFRWSPTSMPRRFGGPQIERRERFPQGVNAGYMQVIDRANIRLRVWERGAGETLACGTGACAAVVAGIRRGLLASPVNVATLGGVLGIAWAGAEAPVMMTGPAETVFEGEWSVSD